MKLVLPSGKLLALIFLVSLVNPAHYALLFLFPPENRVFLGYPDDNLMLALMKSPSAGFEDPWSFDDGKVWHNPLIGSVFFFIILGIIPLLLKMDLYLSFIFFKFLFSVFYYIVVYNLICLFMKNDRQRNIALLIFMFVAGLGGIIYLISLVVFPQNPYTPIIGYALTNEFNELSATSHSLTHTFRLYYMVPETIGYLALIFYLSRKKIAAGLMLGLAFLFYPSYGIAFSLVIFIQKLLKALSTNKMGTLKELFPIYLLAGLFTIPWVVAGMERPYYYKISPLVFEGMPTINILVGGFFPLLFVFYYLRKKSLIPKIMKLIVPVIVAILFFLKQFHEISLRSPLFSSWLASLNLVGLVTVVSKYSFIIDVAMTIVAILTFLRISKTKLSLDKKFLLSWLIIFVIISGISPETFFRFLYTGRQAAVVIFPLSVLAAAGIIEFSKSAKKDAFLVVVLIILLSAPSLLGYNLWLQKSVRESGISGFFTKDEYDALKVLKDREDGNVISSVRFGSYIPYYTGKRTLLFTGRIFDGYLNDVNDDYKKFYTGNDSDRMSLINRYRIKYVIFGFDEQSISKFNPELANYLEKIYDGETKIYKVL